MDTVNFKRAARQFAGAVCLMFAAFALPSAHAQQHQQQQSRGWRRVRSENFVVVSNTGDWDARRAIARLEELRAVFSRLSTGGGFDVSIPITVVLFQSDADYEFFKPIYDGHLRSDASGYFQPGADVNYITFSLDLARGRDTISVLTHEYVHALVRNNYAGAPLWFNEGLAQYYSESELSPDRKRINFGQRLDFRLAALARPDELLPLKTLLSVDLSSPHYHEPEKRAVFYAQSWALIHYLSGDASGARQAQLARYLELASAGTSIEESFRQAFKIDFGQMESELRAYVRSTRYASRNESFSEPLSFKVKAESRALTAAEAEATLGDLLLHTDRPADAEEYFARALRADANLAAAHSSLGLLRLKQDRLSEAREHLQLATQGDPQNHLAHFYYADVLRREGLESEKTVPGYAATTRLIRAELKRVLELAPNFLEAYALLGLVDLERSPQVDETFALLRHAATLAPKRLEFNLLLARLHLRREEFDRARHILESLARDSRSPNARAEAQAWLEKVALGEEQFAARRKAQSYLPGGAVKVETNAVAAGGVASAAAGEGAAKTPPGETLPNETQPCDMPQPGPQFKALRFDGRQVCGQLISVECEDTGGVTLLVETRDGTLKLRSAALNRIRFVTYTADVRGRIECGLRTRSNPVLVTYRLSPDAGLPADGEALAVEFVPLDWVH